VYGLIEKKCSAAGFVCDHDLRYRAFPFRCLHHFLGPSSRSDGRDPTGVQGVFWRRTLSNVLLPEMNQGCMRKQ
jgi:hypothetical protein